MTKQQSLKEVFRSKRFWIGILAGAAAAGLIPEKVHIIIETIISVFLNQ